jgi:hypothetical protein
MKFALPILGALLLCAGGLQAQGARSLSTTFANNNSGGVGGTVFFDVTVTNALDVTALDVNFLAAAQTPVGLKVYTCPNTYQGNEGSMSARTQVGQDNGSATAAGVGAPTTITMQTPFKLVPGTYGMALEAVGSGHAYTNGNGSNQSYSNADLALQLGAATNTAFGGSPFTPRVWNGAIWYNPAGGGPYATATQFGKGSVVGSPPGPVDAGPFQSTFSSTLTRGFYFQTPAIPIIINGFRVPNEANQPQQAVAFFTMPQMPPAFSASYQITANDVKFFAEAQKSGTVLRPKAPIVIQPNTWVGVLGAGQATGSTTMYNSYGGSAVSSSVLGQPITLNRLLYQGTLAGRTDALVPVSTENAGSIGRVELYVVGQTSTPTPPLLSSIGTPGFGNSPKLDLKGNIASAQFGLINMSLAKLPTAIPTPFGDLLIVPSFFLQIPVAGGTGTTPGLPIPNDQSFLNVSLYSQALVVDLTNNIFGMSNGMDWKIAN